MREGVTPTLDNKAVNAFALKWLNKLNKHTSPFDDEDIEVNWGLEMKALGFQLDCGESFCEAFPASDPKDYPLWNIEKLKEVINEINSIELLTSAIFSRWRYHNHWDYGGAERHISNPQNKPWFILALTRLAELSG